MVWMSIAIAPRLVPCTICLAVERQTLYVCVCARYSKTTPEAARDTHFTVDVGAGYNSHKGVEVRLSVSVVDMLPHKSNLVRWHLAVYNCCPLCSRQQTLSHVLSDCPVSLEQGRYTWRHDQILSIIKDGLKNRL